MRGRRPDEEPIGDPEEFAVRQDKAAKQAQNAGRVDDAIVILTLGADRLAAEDPIPPVLGWLEYNLAELLFVRPGTREDSRDEAIAVLKRAVKRGIESVPELYQKAWGSLGDRYATRTRGDVAENRRLALDAYECALRMAPPISPEAEWALNSAHYGTTLLEDAAGDPAVAAESVTAHWQAAQASHRAGAIELSQQATTGCAQALAELVRRVDLLNHPSPFEVAKAPVPSPGVLSQELIRQDSEPEMIWQGERLRMQAVVAVVMTEQRMTFVDLQVIEAAAAWEDIADKALDVGQQSLHGVARHNLGRLLLMLRHPEPGDRESARDELSAAALQIDPEMHPWAWQRNEQELERLWTSAPQSSPPGNPTSP